jgi:hypothetical protein
VIKQIPRLLGPGLNKAGKFPSPIGGSKSVEEVVSTRSRDAENLAVEMMGTPAAGSAKRLYRGSRSSRNFSTCIGRP